MTDEHLSLSPSIILFILVYIIFISVISVIFGSPFHLSPVRNVPLFTIFFKVNATDLSSRRENARIHRRTRLFAFNFAFKTGLENNEPTRLRIGISTSGCVRSKLDGNRIQAFYKGVKWVFVAATYR